VECIDNVGTGEPSAALILANHPVPLQTNSFYFEIEILDSGDTGYVEFNAPRCIANL
jgi:hypothetical protein